MHGLPSGVVAGSMGASAQFEPLVPLLLPALGRDVLVEVALRIHEADADQRHAEVAGFLAVIAREHAETARVNRQRLVQRELGREVGNRLSLEIRTCSLPPRVRAARASSSPARARSYQLQPRWILAYRSSVARGIIQSMRTGLCAVARHSG